MDKVTRGKLDSAVVGSRIWFNGEVNPYRVRARNARYIICTKPFNPKHTVLYTIIDLQTDMRGPDNSVFFMGYETDEQIEANMRELEGGRLEVSHRRAVPLDVAMVSV